VVKRTLFPVFCVVALRTSQRKFLSYMIECGIIVWLVTAHTLRTGCGGISFVTLGALSSGMASRKLETAGRSMVEGGWSPSGCTVTGFTIDRYTGCRMYRIHCCSIIFIVACIAFRWGTGIRPLVAGSALGGNVCAS
jgi:hypothetical protein